MNTCWKSLFRFKNNVEINVYQHSKLNIVCPNPASVLEERKASIPQEQMYENMWIVDKHEYDTCTVNTSVVSFSQNKLLSCNSPLKLKYYTMVFRSYSPPGDIYTVFVPGTKYYFIGKFWLFFNCFLCGNALQVHFFYFSLDWILHYGYPEQCVWS